MIKTLIIALFLVFQSGVMEAWTEGSYYAIIEDASNLMPDNFRWTIKKHEKEFHTGLKIAVPDYGTIEHLIPVIATMSATAITAIKTNQDFATAVEKLGATAKLISIVNSPLHPKCKLANEAWRTDFDIYVHGNRTGFRILWPGIEKRPVSHEALIAMLKNSLARMTKMSDILTETLRKDQKPMSSYDNRSVPFGVGSVAYSHVVSNIAMTWLFIWDQAGGLKTSGEVRKDSNPSEE